MTVGRRAEVLEEMFRSAGALQTAEAELQAKLRSRGILFGDGLLPTYAYAFVTSRDTVRRWAGQAELLIEAAEHLSRRLLSETSFYEAMGLGQDAVELISVNPGYQRNCVLCRPDGIPVGSELKFVELNCDSPAMMSFLDIVAECLLELDAFSSFGGAAKPISASDRLFDTLLACYREYGGKNAAPTIAITDWEGQKTRYEHARLAEHFEARGAPTIVCDPRAFHLVDGELRVKGRRVDLVYRRALASEIIERQTEVEPLLKAYRDGTICMVNPLRSYVAGAKSVLSHLALAPDLPAALSGAAKLVPRTVLLDNEDARATVKATSTRWALKKSESHGGMNVILPGISTEAAWHQALEASRREVWIAQEYLEVPRMELPVVDAGSIAWSEKYYNWNPFVFGGQYAGGLVRVSSTPLINITLGGGLMPTFTS
ncbi:MAG: hypothetical protein JWP01_1828 [Myxococcales bacterium]|nr:hypothetical protein [Myxococcales bacterium]